jgi:hypothetical protein
VQAGRFYTNQTKAATISTMSLFSCCQATAGITTLVIAILTGVVIHLSAIPPNIKIQLNPQAPKTDLLLGKSTIITLTPQQIEEYHRDGAVVVKGLLSETEALKLKESANFAASRLVDVFGLFGSSRYKKIMFDLWRTSPEIASFSLQALPHVAAQLMTTTSSFRLLRDAFFAYAPPGESCGWHVDDAAFFPVQEGSVGPTFWIALDSLKIEEGGGLAVLNRTLFRQTEPLDVTEDVCRKAITGATCEMPDKSPECQAKMEECKMEFDMQPGDAIVWDRYTFHRGVGGTETMPKNAVKQRYSVRFVPQGSKAVGVVHASVQQNEEFDSPYYPQVWPTLVPSELKALENGLDADITLMGAITFMAKRAVNKLRSLMV